MDPVMINVSGKSRYGDGGAGDVLSGVIGALLAQKLETDPAAASVSISMDWQGMRRQNMWTLCMMASDIVEGLIDVLRKQEDTKEQ